QPDDRAAHPVHAVEDPDESLRRGRGGCRDGGVARLAALHLRDGCCLRSLRRKGDLLMSGGLHDLTLTELANGLSAKKFSSREIADALLARIARADGRLHAFTEVYAKEARA